VTAIRFVDGRLYGFDSMRRLVQVFDGDGAFVDTYQAPYAALYLGTPAKPAGSGWAYIDQDAGTLTLCDRDFGKPRVIARVAEEFVLEQTPDKRIFHPAPDRMLMDTNADGSEIFVYLPGRGFTIFSYDGETGMLLGKIEMEAKPMPFDRRWGEEKFERFLAQSEGKPYMQGRNFEVRFPAFFPPITGLAIDPMGYPRVQRGNPKLEPERALIVLDMEGKEVRGALPEAEFRRIAAHNHDWVYLAGEHDGELTITRLSWALFKANHLN
jgi:hypothetical protein